MAGFKGTTMSLIILTMILSKGLVHGQAIISPPADFTGKIGGYANFNCTVEFDEFHTLMSWEINGYPVYNYQHGVEDYPLGNEKYSVTQNGSTFVLTMKDLGLSDGGICGCRVVDVIKTAVLLVLDTPQLFILSPNPVEGSTAEYNCTASFAGPSKEDILPHQYPYLKIFLDEALVDSSIEKEERDGSKNCYQLTSKMQNMTLKASMYEKKLMCVIGTSSPVMYVNATTEVQVLYSVRDVSYTPRDKQYEVGTFINCTASGSPQPNFLWEDTKNSAYSMSGESLKITERMVGSNRFKCTATNSVNGYFHQESVVVVFEAVFQENQNSDSSKIAVGIIIPLCIILGGIIAFLYYSRVRKKKSSELSGHDDIPCTVPLLGNPIQWEYEEKPGVGLFIPYPEKMNVKIEEAYSRKESTVKWVEKEDNGQEKEIVLDLGSFSEMDGTKIRRRDLSQEGEGGCRMPDTWSSMSEDDGMVKLRLNEKDKDYKNVAKAFRQTVPQNKILKIERLQNPVLYRRYFAHKMDMNTKRPNMERMLWHGTRSEVADDICTNGFTRIHNGANDVTYGRGVYFTRDALDSVKYCNPDSSGYGVMFYASILTGDYCVGEETMYDQPSKDLAEPNILYDSTVDDLNDPGIFVVYMDTQVYTHYLITFR